MILSYYYFNSFLTLSNHLLLLLSITLHISSHLFTYPFIFTFLYRIIAPQQKIKYVEMEKKFESSMYNDEMMKSKKYDIERNLRNELNILRIKHNETIKEHHKERDSHIKGQSIMRKTVEKQRKLIDEKNNTINELNIKIENAIESRTDMELGLKSVRLKFDRSTNVVKKLQEELKNMETVCDERVSASKEEVEGESFLKTQQKVCDSLSVFCFSEQKCGKWYQKPA